MKKKPYFCGGGCISSRVVESRIQEFQSRSHLQAQLGHFRANVDYFRVKGFN
jgi:galactitol-specific phosphotransferase system IIB component